MAALLPRETIALRKAPAALSQATSKAARCVAAAAIAFGHCVRQIYQRKWTAARAYLHHRLYISGRICAVQWAYSASVTRRHSGVFYSRTPLSSATALACDFLIVYQAVSGYPIRYFIFPMKDIVAAYGDPRKWRHGTKILHLPVMKVFSRRPHILSFWEYADAWHLIPKKAAEKTT